LLQGEQQLVVVAQGGQWTHVFATWAPPGHDRVPIERQLREYWDVDVTFEHRAARVYPGPPLEHKAL
jgi:hypothetical protein